MKPLLVSMLLAGLATLWLSASAQASPHDPGVNARQHRQHERIRDGVRDGSLTNQEARSLRAEQKAIRAEERQYKADGVLSREERRDLHQDLNAASRHIYQERHDAERRF